MALPPRAVCGILVTTLVLLGLYPGAHEVNAQSGLDLEPDTLTQSVLIHPPIAAHDKRLSLVTREHTYRSQLRLGDQLARDFMVKRVGDDGIPRAYKPGTDGESNEDWYGWQRNVLAPFDGTVTQVAAPDTVNVPGTMNRKAQPGLIVFHDETEDIVVIYAHVREIEVQKGQTVEAGDIVAKVGNNGNSRAPHVHVGAWKGGMDLLGAKKGGTPLQIQVDLYAAERSRSRTSSH